MDLAATFLEIAGVKRPDEMSSKSLLPLLKGKTDKHRDFVLSGLSTWRMVFDGRYKLIKDFGEQGGTLLFDLQNDPLENTDISAGSPDVVKRLSGLLK
jgi:arylsulfatase A-like enzyme